MLDKIRSRRKPTAALCTLSLDGYASDKVLEIGKLAFTEDDYPEIRETLLNVREVDPDFNDMPSIVAQEQQQSASEERKEAADKNSATATTESSSNAVAEAENDKSKISEEAMAKKIMENAAASSINAA